MSGPSFVKYVVNDNNNIDNIEYNNYDNNNAEENLLENMTMGNPWKGDQPFFSSRFIYSHV